MRRATSLIALAAASAIGYALTPSAREPIAAPRRDGWRITDLFPALLWRGTPMSHSAGKRATPRPKVNPAGTKLARMAKEGRCGVWK